MYVTKVIKFVKKTYFSSLFVIFSFQNASFSASFIVFNVIFDLQQTLKNHKLTPRFPCSFGMLFPFSYSIISRLLSP